MMMQQRRQAAFFDRDGTIIKDVCYLSSFDQIEFIERTLEICRLFQDRGYILFLVTNQSGVARGFFNEAFVQASHRYLFDLLEKRGIFFTQAYYCPHHPEGQVDMYTQRCACRKPEPGMLKRAEGDYGVDLKSSIMIGDSECDLEAGLAAGCRSFDINKLLALQNCDLEGIL